MIKSAVQIATETQAKGEIASSVRVREASFDDYSKISSLESRYGLETKSYEEWNHLWTSNPLYRTLGKDWPIGWVLEDAYRRVVGHLGNIPLLYKLGNTSVLPMVAWALKKCRDENIHMLESLGYSGELGNVIANLAPLRRKLRGWMYYYKAANQLLVDRLANPQVWNPSCFDGDSSL
jgi:hypothetical protein